MCGTDADYLEAAGTRLLEGRFVTDDDVHMFRRSPGPALAAVVTLALGIGANTAIFTLANASMWKPIPLLDVENITMAAVGLYGVLSYAVRQRTHEIGIRMALGATVEAVQLSVVRRGLILAGIGLAIGLTFSFAATQAIASMLYGIHATDPVTFAGASLTLLAIALVASYLPAWRAARVDAVETLRHE